MEARLSSRSEAELQMVIYGRLSARPQPQLQIRGELHGPGDLRKRWFEAATTPVDRVVAVNEESPGEAEQRGSSLAKKQR